MSDRTNPRTEAKYKPTLNAIHYWKERNKQQGNATPQEYREALNVVPEPIGPRAISKEIDKAIRHAY